MSVNIEIHPVSLVSAISYHSMHVAPSVVRAEMMLIGAVDDKIFYYTALL